MATFAPFRCPAVGLDGRAVLGEDVAEVALVRGDAGAVDGPGQGVAPPPHLAAGGDGPVERDVLDEQRVR